MGQDKTMQSRDQEPILRPHPAPLPSLPAFQQMKLGRDQFCPMNSPLVGFGGMKVQLVGTITLPVLIGAHPQQIIKEVNFLVMDYSSSYNTIIGRPILNSQKAVTYTYHLSIKFPTEYGIGQVQGKVVNFSPRHLNRLSSLSPARVFAAPQRWWGGDGVKFQPRTTRRGGDGFRLFSLASRCKGL